MEELLTSLEGPPPAVSRVAVVAAILLAAWLALPLPAEAATPQDAQAAPVELGDQACLDCHGALLDAELVHDPVDSESCEACHPQADPDRHEFDEVEDLSRRCMMCHDDFEGAIVHDPVAEGDCAMCHRPHGGPRRALLRGSDDLQLCGMCHDEQLGEDAAAVHGPVAAGECTPCHRPHASDHERLLKREPPGLCLTCHMDLDEGLEEAAVVHPPVEEDCGLCHDAHASDNPFQLRRDAGALCLVCHADVKQQVTGSKVVHGPALTGRACLNCHLPHHSEEDTLLQQVGQDLCLSCHEKSVERADGSRLKSMGRKLRDSEFLHAPVEDGDCSLCHGPHGSDHAGLLKGSYPGGLYAPFATRSYRLCFGCHDVEAFEAAETDELTGFRNGTKNLHFVHVNRETKGRTCRVCHDAHGSGQPAQVNEVVRFGNWSFPLRFERRDDGGTCASACHEDRAYKR